MREPPRLRHGEEDLLAATLLDAARAYHRPSSSRARILKMLGLPIAVSVGAPASVAIASSLATKLVILVTAASVMTGGGIVAYRVHTRGEIHRAQPSRTSHVEPARAARTQVATATTPIEPSITVSRKNPPVREPATTAAVAVRSPARTVSAPSPPRPSAVALNISPARPTAPIAGEVFLPAPPATPDPARLTAFPQTLPRAPASPSPRAAPAAVARTSASFGSAAPRPAAAPPVPAPLEREVALLDAAERAERGQDFRGALARLDEYDRAFPDGMLRAEAQVLRIAALLGNGDETSARAQAQSFLASSAPSPLTARVRSMLAEKSRQTKELP